MRYGPSGRSGAVIDLYKAGVAIREIARITGLTVGGVGSALTYWRIRGFVGARNKVVRGVKLAARAEARLLMAEYKERINGCS